VTKKQPASAALAELAELGRRKAGARRWAPPAELEADIIAARQAGTSFDNIARALCRNGVEVSLNAVSRWLRDRDID
jgi:hypothetical protein